MTVVKYKKYRLPWYNNMFADLLGTDRLLTTDLIRDNNWMPAMNIKEKEESFEIELAVPGFTKNNFEIIIDNGVLQISAEKEVEKEIKEEDYTHREFIHNSFARSFPLPENVNDEDDIDAKYKNGILYLKLAKLHEDQISHKRVIEIS